MQKAAVVLLVAGLALLARPAAAQCNYVIEEGDTLYDIAQSLGLKNESELLAVNPSITDPELIYAGEVIKLPCDPKDDATSGKTIYDLLANRSDMSLLFTALNAVGLAETVKDRDLEGVLFAPTDAAIAGLVAKLDITPAALLNDTALLTDVLSYHFVPWWSFELKDLSHRQRLDTLLKGKKLQALVSPNGNVRIKTVADQRVPIEIKDVKAGKAYVNIIEEVLLPLESEAPAETPTAAPEKPTKPTKPGKKPECEHTVVEGDTLFDLATALEVSLDSVIALNPKLENPELIKPGEIVILCEKAAGAKKPAPKEA